MLLPLPHLAMHLFMYYFSSIRPARLPTEPWSHTPSQLPFFLLESPSFTFLQGIAKVIQIYFSMLYQGVDWTFCPSIYTFHLTPFSSRLLLYLLPRQAFITSFPPPPEYFTATSHGFLALSFPVCWQLPTHIQDVLFFSLKLRTAYSGPFSVTSCTLLVIFPNNAFYTSRHT